MDNSKQILIIPALCLLAFTSCSNSPTSASLQNAQNIEMQNRVTDISAVVANLRGLNFIRPVHVGVISRAQYSQNTAQSISNSFTSVEQAALSKEYLQMGCLSETDTPIGQILTDYYSGFPAAYYVPGTDSLYILTDAYSNDTELNVYISHELTHALQDQHLGMNFTVFPGYSYYNDDANLAQTSLLEGDASFIEYTYLISTYYSRSSRNPFSDAETLALFIKDDFLTAADTTIHKPFFLNVKGALPYDLGMAYVATLYSASSQWNTVNALYSISTIPRSSAEINLGTAFSPGYFDFHELQNLLALQSPQIVFADDDNGGFALLLGLFYTDLDTQSINRSLDWFGDRYTFVMRNGQTYGTLVWAMAFSSTSGAMSMFSKFDNLIRSRHIAGKSPYYASIDSITDSLSFDVTYSYNSPVLSTTLRRSSNQIWWLENTDSLTQPILEILAKQQKLAALGKSAATAPPPFPMALSSTQKRSVVGGVLRHLFNKRR
jgi:hypothetical protein